MARVFVDTSAIYALLDRGDGNHRAARALFERLRKQRADPVITNFVVAEAHALLLGRLGPEVARRWLGRIVWHVERVTVEDEAAALDIVCGHADKTYSYTDATSFAVIKRLRIARVAAFERHFAQFGFELI
jgi:predicted nucleic acid-binding protein